MKNKKDKNEIKEVKMKSPLDMFFKLGEKITKGDPIRQQDFTYYMLWILFLAFFGLFITNIVNFIRYLNPQSLVWGLVGFAIMSLQFFNLKNFYDMRKARKNSKVLMKPEEEHKVEDVGEMLKGFSSKEER